MKRLLLPACLLALLPLAAPAEAPVFRGEFAVAEVSGAAPLGGDRMLLVSDEGQRLFLLSRAAERLRGGRVEPAGGEALEGLLRGRIELADLEDAAWTGDAVIVAASHSRDRLGDAPEPRYRLARLRFDGAGKLLEARQSDALLQAVVQEVPFLADAIRRTPAKAGLNVEGLAWAPEGHLLVGLRAPTVTESRVRPHGSQEDAVVLRVKNPDALFLQPPQPALLGETVKVDLRGQGIRGMCHDPAAKGFWILSGLSPDPNHEVKSPWGLWHWDGMGAPRPVPLPPDLKLETPEAVCPLTVEGRPHLLLVEDGRPASRFALFPRPRLP